MNQVDLIAALSEDTGLSKYKCEIVYRALMNIFSVELGSVGGERRFIPLQGLGRLVRLDFKPRVMNNPREAGTTMSVPGSFRIMFRPGKAFHKHLRETWEKTRG